MDTRVAETAPTLAQARELLCDYTSSLDNKGIEGWPEFFARHCIYRITTRRNRDLGYPLSIMYCENQEMLLDRVEAFEKANIFEPHCYRHILSDSQIQDGDGPLLRLRTNFLCIRTMLDGRTSQFHGEYVDDIVIENERPLFRGKTVVLDSSRIDVMIALPL